MEPGLSVVCGGCRLRRWGIPAPKGIDDGAINIVWAREALGYLAGYR